jgi:hypothetical protein
MKRNRATEAVKYQTPHGQLIPVPVLNALHLHTVSLRPDAASADCGSPAAALSLQVRLVLKLHPRILARTANFSACHNDSFPEMKSTVNQNQRKSCPITK